MEKEILIYGPIYSFVTAEIVAQMAEVEAADTMVMRINTDGGNVLDGFSMAAKFNEFAGKKTVKVDGRAYSMGAFLCCYADEVVALDVSRFMIHRAAYPDWFEKSDMFTDQLRAELTEVNAMLMDAIKNRVDVKKFEEITGTKLKEVFSMDSRVDVFLNAKQAKQIGLVSKIEKITPQKRAEYAAKFPQMAALYTPEAEVETSEETQENENDNINKNHNTMTAEDFKLKHPEAAAAMTASAEKAGAEKEKNRVAAWLKFNEVDPAAVKAGIESGESITEDDITKFVEAKMTANAAAQIEAETTAEETTVETTKVDEKGEETAEDKALADFESKIDAALGIKNEKENK